jgi:two-component system, cell cycle sensor histidine kinase and response regulator CckA
MVIEAADDESAKESFRAHLSGIDVALLDMTLPTMSGQQVFQELRRLRPDIKVVLTTAYSEDLEVMNAAARSHGALYETPINSQNSRHC